MSKRNPNQRTTLLEAFAIYVVIAGVAIIIFATGRTAGVDVGRNEVSAREHYEAVKNTALAACTDIEPTALRQCVVESTEAAQNKSEARQDLYAQQDMSRWAFWMMIISGCTLLVTGLGIVWIRATLIETRRAVKAADDAVNVTREIGQTQTRAYLDAVKFDILPVKLGDELIFYGMVHLKNSGQSPAVDVLVRVSTRNAPHDQFKKLGRIGAGVTEIAQMQLPFVSHEEGEELILGADVMLSYDTVFSDIGRIKDAHSAPFSARFHPQDRVPQEMVALGSRVIVVG